MTLVRLRDPGTTPAVRDDWLARDLDVTDRPIPSSINAISDLRPVPVVVAVLAGLLGMAPAGQALLLALRRRQGDVAVQRALGLRPRQAAGIVRWQSATQALFAVIIGLPFGLVIGRSLAGVERPGRWCGRDYRDGRVHLIMTARRRP